MNAMLPFPRRLLLVPLLWTPLGGSLCAETPAPSIPPRQQLLETAASCRDLSLELALGLKKAEACREELADLIRHGDDLLEASGGRDLALLASRQAVEAAVATTARIVLEAKAVACTQTVASSPASGEKTPAAITITVDPWGGANQECGFFPPRLGPVSTNWEGVELPESDLGYLPRQIPARYRLAEALGAGRNRLHAELHWIDPELMRRQTNAEWGIHIFARLHCVLRGQFVAKETDSSLPPLETFHIGVSSQGFQNIATNRFGADLGNPKAYRTEMNDAGMLNGRSQDNPWYGENLAAAAAERGWRVVPFRPSPSTDPKDDWLGDAIERELASRREKVAAAVRNDPSVIAALVTLEDLQTAFVAKRQSTPTPSPDAAGANSGPLMNSHPGLSAVSRLVASGDLYSSALQRVASVARIALDSALRETCSAASPAAVRGDANNLAQALDALQAWTLR